MGPKARLWILWGNVGTAALGLVLLLLGAGASDEATVVAGALLLGVVCFTAPVAKWGAIGLLLTMGLILTLGGGIAWSLGDVAESATDEVNDDNDGDGKVNEDPEGDADGSAEDPTRAENAAELTTPEDDDGDGRIDEDPPAPIGAETASEGARSVGQMLTAVGAGVVVLFAFLAWLRTKERPSNAPEAPRPAP